MRTLAVTQNITVDGSIEMLGDWFSPQGQDDVDNSDLLEKLHRQSSEGDGLVLAARRSKTSAATGRSTATTPRASPTPSTGCRSTSSPQR